MAKLTERQRTDSWRRAFLKSGVKAPEQRIEPTECITKRTIAVYERNRPATHRGITVYNRLI